MDPKYSTYTTSWPDQDLKSKFLRAGKKYLTECARDLLSQGLIEDFSASVNPGGPAVEGEVYLTLWLSDIHAIQTILEARDGKIQTFAQHRVISDFDLKRHKPTKAHPKAYPSTCIGGNMYDSNRVKANKSDTLKFLIKCIASHPSSEEILAQREKKILSNDTEKGITPKKMRL